MAVLHNIILGFIIPWIFGVILLIKDWNMMVLIFPFAGMISFFVNTLGFYYFWDLKPVFKREQSLSRLPIEIGLYPILACYLIYYVRSTSIHSAILIVIFALFTTVLEYLAVIRGKVIYRNGWNIYFTLLSYLGPYILVYFYYLSIRQYIAG